eukprot:CAMPEP_0197564120 /NCGR_PEP_ID=MMETSP1320-20131121/29898_1 /TAXON_ID=91990 /ORGANISM="Bolidomonas sp., Strain RCC2347" /LENGTH=96 /DNA_ID=CAMNT_0043126011 /DNA_START=122 /DNA_END=409 /DNA_ORIENTATION=-
MATAIHSSSLTLCFLPSTLAVPTAKTVSTSAATSMLNKSCSRLLFTPVEADETDSLSHVSPWSGAPFSFVNENGISLYESYSSALKISSSSSSSSS